MCNYMRLFELVLLVGVTVFVALFVACGDDGSRSPREVCLDTEIEINEAAKACDPQFGSVDLSCDNYGTGSGCDAIDDYFACLSNISCDSGTVVFPSGCQLGICE
jgi:hypothetical protein